MRMGVWKASCACLMIVVVAGPLQAQERVGRDLDLWQMDGFRLSSLWASVHDSGFDLFHDEGPTQSGDVLERPAGDSTLGMLQASPVGEGSEGIGGTAEVPRKAVDSTSFEPGQTAADHLTVDPMSQRFTTLTPATDAFVGNDSPFAIELFNGQGAWRGTHAMDLTGWDLGIEANAMRDGAFVRRTARDAEVPLVQGMVHQPDLGPYNPFDATILDSPPSLGIYFDPRAGSIPRSNPPVPPLTPLPEPATAVLLAAGGLCLLSKRARGRSR